MPIYGVYHEHLTGSSEGITRIGGYIKDDDGLPRLFSSLQAAQRAVDRLNRQPQYGCANGLDRWRVREMEEFVLQFIEEMKALYRQRRSKENRLWDENAN